MPGVAALGFGTGIATATNLALMLDMTTPEQVGLFIGAWGLADALARGAGMLLGGVVRDLVSGATGNPSSGYITVFLIEAIMLAGSLLLLRAIDVSAFRARQPTLTELVALAGDACIVIGGRAGTISEVCLAWLHKRPLLPLVGCGGWSDGLPSNPPDERKNSPILPWGSIAELEVQLKQLKLA